MVSNGSQQRCSVAELIRNTSYMSKFKLYETRTNFYLIGREQNGTIYRVLKINRLDPPNDLNIHEDMTDYSDAECDELLRRIHDGNRSTGGLKLVTACYGIIGFVKFLGPHYMLIITKRRKMGAICGHPIYAITKSRMIPIPSSTTSLLNKTPSKNENRYKKLICTVDLTKDFFYSHSYHLMFSLQSNLCSKRTGQSQSPYESMFVWNEFLTRAIRNRLKNSQWIVALVYGFFKQVKLSPRGRDFTFTLISRRSRHFAGTRYLKRGVNEKGRVANDVETEQILYEQTSSQSQVSSVVQIRGSIPLFWSQEASLLNIKPDIVLSNNDRDYAATRLHFENLQKRYDSPIIILNLIKSHEKKARESLLRSEFANAINAINRGLVKEKRLKFLHWDLHKKTQKKDADVLLLLGKVAAYAMNLTGIFHCRLFDDGAGFNSPLMQNGVLRTNCIDCLDRTNVAQYAYGLAALGYQLRASGFDWISVDIDSPMAIDVMSVYERMGDTLALQYTGSPAHNKVFSEKRGQCRAATQSQELFRTLQRHYSNAYTDAEKQDAINLFLGYFQPHIEKPALWELNSDQHYNIGRLFPTFSADSTRGSLRRSRSDGSGLAETLKEEEDVVVPDASSSPHHHHHHHHDLLKCHHTESCSSDCSNFLDVDLLSSSPSDDDGNSYTGAVTRPDISPHFLHWVNNGGLLSY